jgi:hypothetical protein
MLEETCFSCLIIDLFEFTLHGIRRGLCITTAEIVRRGEDTECNLCRGRKLKGTMTCPLPQPAAECTPLFIRQQLARSLDPEHAPRLDTLVVNLLSLLTVSDFFANYGGPVMGTSKLSQHNL